MSPVLPLKEAVANAEAAGNKVNWKVRCYLNEHGIATSGDKVELNREEDIGEGEFWVPVYWTGLDYRVWQAIDHEVVPVAEAMAYFKKPAADPRERILYLRDYHEQHDNAEARIAHRHLSKAIELIGDDPLPETWAALYHAFYGGEHARDHATLKHRDIAIKGEPSAVQILKRVRGEWKKLDYPETHKTIAALSGKGVKPKALFEALKNDDKITFFGMDKDGHDLYMLGGDKKPFRYESWRKKVKDLRERLS